MRTFLVTGGAGFIGSHIAEALVRRGDRVRVIDNLSTGHVSNLDGFRDKVEFIEGDLRDADTVAKAVDGVDCVFHEAALASVPRSVEFPLDTHAHCVTATVTLLDAARRAGVRRLVYAASSSAYGDQPNSSKRETDLPDPISPYGAAKLAAEYYCQAFCATYALETVRLRYFNVFGPRQDPDSPYSAVIPLFHHGDAPRPAADDLRRRPAVARFHVRRQRRPRQPPGRRRGGRQRAAVQLRQRPDDRPVDARSGAQRTAGHERPARPRRPPRRRRPREHGRHHPGQKVARLRHPSPF